MRKVVFFSVAIISIILLTVLTYNRADYVSNVPNFTQTTKPVVKIKRYYIAVTNLASDRDNIEMQEFARLAREGKVTVLSRDKRELSSLLKCNLDNTVPGVSSIKLPIGGVAILRISDVSPAFKLLTVGGKSIWENDDYPLFLEAAKEPSERQFNRASAIKMTSVGDIILGRTVYRKMTEKGYLSPFSHVAGTLAAADLTFGDLECPLSDAFTPPAHGMAFVAPKRAIEGIKASGFDILGLANNHSTNFGTKALTDTLATLKQNNIEYVGGGYNESEAKSFKVLTIKGKKFVFLSFNCIIGDLAASENSPGDWHVKLEPWERIDQDQICEVVTKVEEARKAGDFVIVMAHWGQEYTHDPNPQMISLARQIIDAGADLIVGTHPHWTQGVEVYKGKLITYSLGNFVFDQEWSRKTKQGLILDTIFYEDKLASATLTPVLIKDFHRPRILGEEEGKPIMDTVWASSMKISEGF